MCGQVAGDCDHIEDHVLNGEKGGGEVHLFVQDDVFDPIIEEVEGGHKFLPVHGRGLFWLDQKTKEPSVGVKVQSDPVKHQSAHLKTEVQPVFLV